MQPCARTDNRKIHGHAVELAHRLEMLVKLQGFQVPRQRALENSQDQPVVRFESLCLGSPLFYSGSAGKGPAVARAALR